MLKELRQGPRGLAWESTTGTQGMAQGFRMRIAWIKRWIQRWIRRRIRRRKRQNQRRDSSGSSEGFAGNQRDGCRASRKGLALELCKLNDGSSRASAKDLTCESNDEVPGHRPEGWRANSTTGFLVLDLTCGFNDGVPADQARLRHRDRTN